MTDDTKKLIAAGAVYTLVLALLIRRAIAAIPQSVASASASASSSGGGSSAAAAPVNVTVMAPEPVYAPAAEFYSDQAGVKTAIAGTAGRRLRIHGLVAWNVGPKDIEFRTSGGRVLRPSFSSMPTQAGVNLRPFARAAGYWETGIGEGLDVYQSQATPFGAVFIYEVIS